MGNWGAWDEIAALEQRTAISAKDTNSLRLG